MAENQTKAQVILEANSAAFMAQIRSVAVQAQGIFNRVFSALRLPALLSIGGLVAGALTMPTTGRTIGEAVQMQRLHAQLDRLNATLVAELAPIRVFILRILIVLLGVVNAIARVFSGLMTKFPEIGDFIKGLAILAVVFFGLKNFIAVLSFLRIKLIQAVSHIAGAIFRHLKLQVVFPGGISKLADGLMVLSEALSHLFVAWVTRLGALATRLTAKFNVLGLIIKLLQAFGSGLQFLVGTLGNSTNKVGKFFDRLLSPILNLGRVIVAVVTLIMAVVNFLVSGVISLVIAAVGWIASAIAGVASILGIFGAIATIALGIVAIAGVVLLAVIFWEQIVNALKFLGSLLWNALLWIGWVLKAIGGFLLNIILVIGKWLLKALYYLIVVPIAFLGKLAWKAFTSLFEGISDWFKSLFEQPPFTIQGMSSFGGFGKEELELASPRLPELVTIGTTAINLLDQIKKLIEQQRSAAIKRVSGI
jgi:hypothetical protein